MTAEQGAGGALGPEPQKDDGGKGRWTLAIDFDGVLHAYSRGWDDGTIYDRPVPGSQTALATLQAAGYRLVVFTARRELDDIRAWLAAAYPNVAFADVTNEKPIASLYIDDRAVRFIDWEQALDDVGMYLDINLHEEPATRRAYDDQRIIGKCPACDHESLYRNDQGYIVCGYLACIHPSAIADLLEFDDHAVTFTATTWFIEHSLGCRVKGTMTAGECRYQAAVVAHYGAGLPPEEFLGRWIITDIDAAGLPVLLRAFWNDQPKGDPEAIEDDA